MKIRITALAWVPLFICFSVVAQDFSFPLYFEDAVGNRDTLILGLDDTATEGVDTQFQELNIVDQPLSDNLDVRVSDGNENAFWNNPATYHLKKQILGATNKIQQIDIKCNHYPIKASWDNSIFQDAALYRTLITSIPPGGWWDVGSPSDLERVFLRESESVWFTANFWNDSTTGLNEYYAYLNEAGDTLSAFWFVFDADGLGVNSVDLNEIDVNVFPNPTTGNIVIDTKLQFDWVELYDIMGNLVLRSQDEQLDISKYVSGVYFMNILKAGKRVLSQQVVKY